MNSSVYYPSYTYANNYNNRLYGGFGFRPFGFRPFGFGFGAPFILGAATGAAFVPRPYPYYYPYYY